MSASAARTASCEGVGDAVRCALPFRTAVLERDVEAVGCGAPFNLNRRLASRVWCKGDLPPRRPPLKIGFYGIFGL